MEQPSEQFELKTVDRKVLLRRLIAARKAQCPLVQPEQQEQQQLESSFLCFQTLDLFIPPND